MGRKTIITKEFCDEFCDYLERGCSIYKCCEKTGIDSTLFYIWKKKAEDGKEPFATFIARVEEIQSRVKPKKIGNRNTKLNKVICDKICEGVLKGNYISTVCKSVGIGTSTYNAWKRKGKQGIEPYKQFYDRVTECEAQAEMDILNVIYTNAIDQGNWLSSAWILERKYPNRFGKREQMALQTDNDFKLEISTAKSPYELGEEEKKLLEEDRKDE